MSRLRQRSRLREIANRRQQASNNNNGEHTLLDQNIVTPTNAVPEPHPTEPARNNANNNITNQGACGGGTTKKPTPKQEQPEGSDSSSTITVPKQRCMIKNSQRRKIREDLITIYESDDEIKYVEDPVDTWALQQHRAGNRDPRFTSASRAERRHMMENGMWPLNGTGKVPPQPTSADGNDNIGRAPIVQVQETIYLDNEALPYYEYIEVTATESGSSQYLDPDSSDDDGHRECGLGGYENCPDNPANRPTMQHQEGNFDESFPDPSDRGIT